MRWFERVGDALPYPLRYPRAWLRHKKNAVKWFIQRGRRGYSDYDLYSFDAFLVPMLIEVLPKYTNTGEFGKVISFHDPEVPRCEDPVCHVAMASWDEKVTDAVVALDEWRNRDWLDIDDEGNVTFNDQTLDLDAVGFVIRHIGCFWW